MDKVPDIADEVQKGKSGSFWEARLLYKVAVRKIVILCLLWVSLSHSVPAFGLQCFDLFTVKTERLVSLPPHQAAKDYEFLLNVMRRLETDRFLLFPRYSQWSVYDFLKEILRIHEDQNQRIQSHSFSNVPRQFLEEYKNHIQTETVNTATQFALIAQKFDLRRIKVEDILQPKTPETESLQSHVISLVVAPITVMAELLVAVRYGNVRSTEENIPSIVPHWEREIRLSDHHLNRQDFFDLERKTVDILSTHPHEIYLIEVKFFGRHKVYDSVSGKGVFTKLSHLKQVTSGNKRIKVILAIVGPGELSPGTLKHYAENGVEVVHLTPDWYKR